MGIEAAADKRDKFILRFEDGTGLACGLGEIADFRLRPDMELDDAEFDKLGEACAYYGVRERAAALLSARPMSAGELKQRLAEKGASREQAEKAAEWLEGLGLIDDAEYAAMVVRHYAGRGYGGARIKNELFKRRIPRELWEGALEEMPESGGAIDRYLSLKLGGEAPDDRKKRKICDALRRRGFSWDEISGALERYAENLEHDEENTED